MTKLEELRIDLSLHEASLEKLQDPAHAAKLLKFYKTDVCFLIPSYVKIIKSIKDEIASLEGKNKPKTKTKKPATAKTVTKKTPKK
jgi:hypothetical protein